MSRTMSTRKDWVEGILFAGFRLMAVALLLTGLLGMAFQLLDSWYRFDPNYLGAYFAEILLRPFILCMTGGILYLLSRWMAHRMAARYHRHSS